MDVAWHQDVRIPSWSRGEAVPSDLYEFAEVRPKADPTDAITTDASTVGSGFSRTVRPTMWLNHKKIALALNKGYARIHRRWQKGDVVQLDLPMPVRRVLANDAVVEDRGKAAIERGPIVYCLEAIDNGGHVTGRAIPLDAELQHEFRRDLLGGVEVVTGNGIVAVPYFAWNNRGKGDLDSLQITRVPRWLRCSHHVRRTSDTA